jgi:hypothetical protein
MQQRIKDKRDFEAFNPILFKIKYNIEYLCSKYAIAFKETACVGS